MIGTDERKPFLETAPYLIVIFGKNHSYLPDGRRVKNYYVNESVGIATGFLIAIHFWRIRKDGGISGPL